MIYRLTLSADLILHKVWKKIKNIAIFYQNLWMKVEDLQFIYWQSEKNNEILILKLNELVTLHSLFKQKCEVVKFSWRTLVLIL